MGHQIIKQPNGLYCLYHTVLEDFILVNVTPDDIVNDLVDKYREDMNKIVEKIVDDLENNKKPYYQFTMSFDEAVKKIAEIYGKDTESLKALGV